MTSDKKKGKKRHKSKYLKTFEQYKKMYFSFKPVRCPALNDCEVKFTNFGWNHLCVRKWRTEMEKLERMELLPYARKLISKTTTIQSIRYYDGYKTFEFNANMDGKRVTALVSTTKEGFIFYSNFKDDNNSM